MLGTTCFAEKVSFFDDLLAVHLTDGRILLVPTTWFPVLTKATPAQIAGYTITPFGLHWPELDESISIEGLIAGRRAHCVASDADSALRHVRDLLGDNALPAQQPL